MLKYCTLVGDGSRRTNNAYVCLYSRETVAALEEAVRVAEKAVGRCIDMEPLLVTARDRLQVHFVLCKTRTSRDMCSQASMITHFHVAVYEIPSLQLLHV